MQQQLTINALQAQLFKNQQITQFPHEVIEMLDDISPNEKAIEKT